MSSRNSDISWVPVAGTVLDGRYELDAVVDRGGMGVIMSAQHLVMKREVAVKVLRPDVSADGAAMARFRREVAVAARLEHPNIVRCHDSGTTPDGGLYLVMEMLRGESLKDLLAREGRLDLRRAGELALQMLDGLSAAHLQGVVHRDIKPGNVYLARDARGQETVKLLDFGLARSIFSEDMQVTQTGKICGTTAYLPPETIVTPEPTTAGDVYACGLVMLELVIGRKVFFAKDVSQSYLQHLAVPAQIPARIWATPFGELVAAALRKHPDERPQTADEMYRRLEPVLPSLPAIRLADHEVPPPPGRLDGEVLRSVAGDGGLDMLRRLPPPTSWPDGTSALVETPRETEFELPLDAAPLELDTSAMPPLRPPAEVAAPRPNRVRNLLLVLLVLVVLVAVLAMQL